MLSFVEENGLNQWCNKSGFEIDHSFTGLCDALKKKKKNWILVHQTTYIRRHIATLVVSVHLLFNVWSSYQY